MSAEELLDALKRAGSVLQIDGEHLACRLPKGTEHFVDLMRQHKPELMSIIRARGGRVATTPRCPECGSYYLYRENNIGNYECVSCELREIPEDVARRTA